MISKQFHSLVNTQENGQVFKQKLAHKYSQQHYSKQEKGGNNPNVHLMNKDNIHHLFGNTRFPKKIK